MSDPQEAALLAQVLAGKEATEIADDARHRYETDAEFHARVYRAAQIGRAAENHLGDLFSEDSALLGAAIALHLTDQQHARARNPAI